MPGEQSAHKILKECTLDQTEEISGRSEFSHLRSLPRESEDGEEPLAEA